jgi:hypothetical protein
MGVLFNLCRSLWARQLIFHEMVGRAAKHILRDIGRSIARDGHARMLIAMRRKRSRPSDYVELKDNVEAKQREAVVDIFNSILGYGSTVDSFWDGIFF